MSKDFQELAGFMQYFAEYQQNEQGSYVFHRHRPLSGARLNRLPLLQRLSLFYLLRHFLSIFAAG